MIFLVASLSQIVLNTRKMTYRDVKFEHSDKKSSGSPQISMAEQNMCIKDGSNSVQQFTGQFQT